MTRYHLRTGCVRIPYDELEIGFETFAMLLRWQGTVYGFYHVPPESGQHTHDCNVLDVIEKFRVGEFRRYNVEEDDHRYDEVIFEPVEVY